jgi:NAD(P)-dependent dehydrogenase (short-subunit alcohol dehydrogenase family)
MQRVAMINGATGGIGGAVARRLLADGYRVSIGTRSPVTDPILLNAIAAGQALQRRFVATEEASAADWAAETAAHFDSIDILVNCVGILGKYAVTDDVQALDDLLAVNMKGPAHCMKHAFPHLQKGTNPKIINFISHAGIQVVSKSAGYATSKYALRALSHAARHQGWDDGIRVTAIFPGWVNTDMIAGFAPLSPADMTQPDDLASVVSFLASLPPTCSIAELVINCELDRI